MASGPPPPPPRRTPAWGACTRRRRPRPTSRAAAAATPTLTRPNSSRSTTGRGRKSFSRTSANCRPRRRKSSFKVSSDTGLLRGFGTNGKGDTTRITGRNRFSGGRGHFLNLVITMPQFHSRLPQILINLSYFYSSLGYSCALVSDILLQGHLYITENYFAFHSNVFGYVTKVRE